jgi:hypothetical protein
MHGQARISAKNLGAFALADACPRCMWLRLELGNRLPFQVFPGIFSSIDSYTKHVVHGWFDRHGSAPPWLAELGDLRGYIEPPHWSRLQWLDPATGILLTGTPDGVLAHGDRLLAIADYKTARYTQGQDALLPMYEVQLNAYAVIGEKTGLLRPVTSLALVYCEPVTDASAATDAANQRADGFAMGFCVRVHHVALRPETIPPLLVQAMILFDMPTPPPGRPGCRNCEMVDGLVEAATA